MTDSRTAAWLNRWLLLLLGINLAILTAAPQPLRLYEGLTALVVNPEVADFTVTVDVRDINHLTAGPAEILVKIYNPDGLPVVREVIPDDGVTEQSYRSPLASWDHEAWYYATCYSRGIIPAIRWSTFSDPKRLERMPSRRFTYRIKGGLKGVYRILLMGTPDHYVTIETSPELARGVMGSVDWLHGAGEMYAKSFLYVPHGADAITVMFFQLDQPANRTFTLKDPSGKTVLTGKGEDGHTLETIKFDKPGQHDGKLFTLEVSSGRDDFLVFAGCRMFKEKKLYRTNNNVNCVFASDPSTARAIQGGAIYHDGKTFWHMFQVRYHDWLKTLKPGEGILPDNLPKGPEFISVGSNERPEKGHADRIMNDYGAHKNRQALFAALKQMNTGLNLITPNDKITSGPLRNMAYEMGCYSFFYQRPAWRILQQSDAPELAKGPIREFMIAYGDRLAFCRAMSRVNGNAFTSLVAAFRYAVEATGDPLHKDLFKTYWKRFTSGGFGDRIGLGPSGGMQESFGYDAHYGGYMFKGWKAIIADLHDERFIEVFNRSLQLYSYIASIESASNPWNSRTYQAASGGAYNPKQEGPFRWKGFGGPDFTVGVNGHNEWFAARRKSYYALTYHGRLTPTWMGEGMYGQVGFGGGILCQLYIPGHGQILSSTLHKSYGKGMGLHNWRNFHIHSVVGETADGISLVTANSEHMNARLDGNTVTSSGEVRRSSVRVMRSYTFEDDSILCKVSLSQSSANKVFHLWAHRPKPREFITEAYEMIPFWAHHRKSRNTDPSLLCVISAVDPDGKTVGVDSEKVVSVSTINISRGGYGVRIEFRNPARVKRGANHTVLIQLVEKKTLPDDVSLEYRLRPWVHANLE